MVDQIGAFPFTTLRPQLGTLSFGDGHSLTVADIPGLIEGAHANRCDSMGFKCVIRTLLHHTINGICEVISSASCTESTRMHVCTLDSLFQWATESRSSVL